jgi:hypothetical protein
MLRSITYLATLAVLLVTLVAGAASPDKQLMNRLIAQYQNNTKARLPQTGVCTAKTLKVRREW